MMARLPKALLIRHIGPVLLACLLVGDLPALSQRAGAAGDRLPVQAPPPLVGLGPTPFAPLNVPVRFRYARHFYRPGETVSASIALSPVCKETRCFEGTNWTIAGAPSAACLPTALRCTWKLSQPPAMRWLVATLPITTTSGPIDSTDVYAVLDTDQSVVEGTIADYAGIAFTGVSVAIAGNREGTVSADSNGYFNVLLPRGAYTLTVAGGPPQASRWFRPRKIHVTLTDRATASFTEFNQMIVHTTAHAVTASGTGVFTATVQVLNPLGQPIAGRLVSINAGGPPSLVCWIEPSAGLVEPQDVVDGAPLYAPVRLPTDGTGTLTLQVFAGTTAGSWHLTASDTATAALQPGANPSRAQVTVAMPAGTRLAHIPAQWHATVYTKGRGKVMLLSLPRLIYDAAHGLTTRDGASLLHGTTDVRTILRWMQAYLPLKGLLLAPLSTAGTTASGVLISTWNGSETRVLDTSLLINMINWSIPIPIYVPKDLPTLAAWQAAQHASAVRAYPGTVPESGLTYNGFPYLPVNVDFFNTFETRCLQKAQGS